MNTFHDKRGIDPAKRKYQIGDTVTVILCCGIVSGKIAEHTFHLFSDEPASRISGPHCCSIVRDENILPHNGKKDKLGSTCNICKTNDCCFRE